MCLNGDVLAAIKAATFIIIYASTNNSSVLFTCSVLVDRRLSRWKTENINVLVSKCWLFVAKV